jgi:hypothetical protein
MPQNIHHHLILQNILNQEWQKYSQRRDSHILPSMTCIIYAVAFELEIEASCADFSVTRDNL